MDIRVGDTVNLDWAGDQPFKVMAYDKATENVWVKAVRPTAHMFRSPLTVHASKLVQRTWEFGKKYRATNPLFLYTGVYTVVGRTPDGAVLLHENEHYAFFEYNNAVASYEEVN